MDYGDETGRSYCEADFNSIQCTSHAYSTAGYYTMWSHCLTEDIHLNDSATIYVGNKIFNMAALVNGQMFVPITTTESKTLTVTYELGTDVFLNITNAITGDPIYSGNSTGFSETRLFSAADFGGVLGQHAIKVTLSNPLNVETRYVVFDVEELILTPVMTTNVAPYMHVYDIATFKETMTSGSNMIGAIEFADIAYVDRKFGQVREMCLNYTWTATGTFEFDVIFSNMVDSEIYTYKVVVQNPVNNITASGVNVIFASDTLDIKFDMTADALFPMGNLNASIIYGDGTSDVLNLMSLTQGTTVNDPSKTYTTGTYFVEISVFSESSHMNFSWTQYVEHPIQGLELVHLPEAPMSESVQNVSIRMTDPSVSPLLNITCVFDIDGTEYVESFDLVFGVNFTIIHPFVGDGNKTITFNCSNKLSNQVGESYMDLYTDCFLDGQLFSPIYKNKDTPVQMYVTDINRLTAKAYVTEMCRNSTRFYWWTLWKVDNANNLVLQTYYEKDYNQPNSLTITWSKMSMAPGLYKIQFLFNLTDIEGGYIIDYVYGNFMLPPFIAGIAGGSTRNIGNDAVIQINSKDASHDPFLYMQWVPFSYKWGCRKSASTNAEMSEVIANFQLQNVSIDVNSLGTDCSDPSWPTNGIIPFDAAAVDDSFWYLFTVDLTKSGDTRRGEAIQGIYVMPSTPPTISINCLRNCLPKIAQDTKLILESLCPECELGRTTFVWEIELFNEATGLYVVYPNLAAILDTGLDGPTLAIKPDSLVYGDVLMFTNTVTKDDNPNSATASYVASVNPPPYGGVCEIEPTEGKAAVTLFTIECLGMLDEGTRLQRGSPDADNNEALKYNVYQKRMTPYSTVPAFSVIGMASESVIKAVLNVGDPANNYTTELIVRITDVFHGYTEIVLPVTVTQPIEINDTWSTEDIHNVTQSFVLDNLVEATYTNDGNIIMQYAEAIASVLNQLAIDHKFENDTTLSNFELGEQPMKWSVGMIDANEFGNDTIPYQQLLDDLLEIPVDKVQNAVVAAMDNLTNEMIAALGQSNVTTYHTIMTAAAAFTNAIRDPLITSSASAINAADALAILTNGYTNLTDYKLDDFFGKSDPNIETAANTLFELVNSLIDVTVPAELPDTYEALSIVTTADARLYVDFMARVNRDDAYALTEVSDLTPEEKVGLFKMRARIQQMKFKQQQELAEVTMRQAIASADSISAMLQNAVCTGCRDDYPYDNFHVTLINDYLMNIDLKIGDVDDSNVTLDGIGDPYLVIKFTQRSVTQLLEKQVAFGHCFS
ncbi:uncharacterized protein LOC117329832 [Pecten maximus]|uniref:uncharacterized protein LOC117329832 n=1 Tax=Pecten maximus TaxID=6579 RepID=UPI001459041E|nr:uncharacterized protein LOC117329832 [Pecten maximus]